MASPVRSPTQDFHVFAGLEGLASSLITREPSQKKIKSENAAAAALAAASPKNRGGGGGLWEHDEPRHSQLSSFLQAEEYVAASTSAPSRKKHARSPSRQQQAQSPPSKEAVVSLAEVVTKNAGTGGVAPLGKLTMLRQMTIDAPVFSVMQDLATPHRSYIYGEKEEKSASRRGIRADDAQRAEARHDLIRSIDSKHRGHKERMLRIKGPYAGIPRRASPSFRIMDVPSRHSSDRVLDHSIMSLLRMSEDDVPNELSGPFRDTDTTRSKPAVKQISTFEDYLERAVNSVRTSPVRFENLGASAKQLDRRQFRPVWTRTSAYRGQQPMLDEASVHIIKRSERAATSLGFAPSREVVSMHRSKPPWQVDPSIYVRAGMSMAT